MTNESSDSREDQSTKKSPTSGQPQTIYGQKKILENPFVGSLVVPIAIVLVGALIIFGVTKMLSAERSYRDLVNEIQSKTFGNKWVAAYELSKQINSAQIPAEDFPWLVENLTIAYKDSVDPRTRSFIIAALGALKSETVLPTLSLSIKDIDLDVKFHTLVALGNMPKGITFDWTEVIQLLKLSDVNDTKHAVIRQAGALALATHVVPEAQEAIFSLLNDPVQLVKYSAATALIAYKDERATQTLEAILKLPYPAPEARVTPPVLDFKQISDLKMSVLTTLQKNGWTKLNEIILETAERDTNNSVALKAKEVLNLLKK